MIKNLSKKVIIITSIIAIALILIIVLIFKYPKSVEKGYLESSKILISSEKFDLVKIYMEEEYPLKGIFKSINQDRRIKIYDLLAKDIEKDIEETYGISLGDQTNEVKLVSKDNLQILEIKILDKVTEYTFTSFTVKNNNEVSVKNIKYKLKFYSNESLVGTKEYFWEGEFKAGRQETMTTCPEEGKIDYDRVEVEIVSFDK